MKNDQRSNVVRACLCACGPDRPANRYLNRGSLAGLAIALALTLVAASCSDGDAVSAEADDFAAWAKTNAHQLESFDIDANQGDLDGLEAIVGDARVVAIGETAHNVREQMQTRFRLFTNLVERQGFRLLAVETSMPHAERINDYVLGQGGDIDELLRQSGTWELMATAEMRDSIEWVRNFNSNVTDGSPVQFYGIDVTTPLPAIESLDAYLQTVDSSLAEISSEALDRFGPLLSQEGDETWRTIQSRYDQVSGGDNSALTVQLNELLSGIEGAEEAYVAASSRQEYDQAVRWATLASNGHENFVSQSAAGPPDSAERVIAGSGVRDPAMADNVLWILDQNPGQRMVLWSHNLHVQRSDPDRVFRVGDSFEVVGITTMGSELSNALGSSYVVMNATLGRGSSPDYGDLPDISGSSLDGLLAQTGTESFYLDIRTVPDDRPSATWIGSQQMTRAEVGTLTLNPTANFDAIYFVSVGTPAQELELQTGG